MKIIIVGTSHPYRGGLATFNDRLALQFLKEGHDVKTITFTLQYPSFLFPGKTQFTDEPAPKGLVSYRQINSCNPFNWIKIGKAISNEKPDLVIFAYWMSFMAPCFGTIARMIRKNGHTRIVGLIHNMIPHEPNILDKLLPYYFVSAMDGFSSLSKSVIDDINKFDKKKQKKTIAPHPIYDHYGDLITREIALNKLNLDSSKKYALFFGFIRDYKGLDLLLKAMSDKEVAEQDIHLIVAGEFYGDPKPYIDLIQDLKIKDRVILRNDFIPDNEVNLYFCATDVVTQTYKTATQSGVTQIAFHFEKPMIVTNVGGLPEIVPDGKIGYVVDPDPKAIAKAIVRFFKENKMSEFTDAIKIEKQKYSWSVLTSAILEHKK